MCHPSPTDVVVKLYSLSQMLFHVSLLLKEGEIGHPFGVGLLVIMLEKLVD